MVKSIKSGSLATKLLDKLGDVRTAIVAMIMLAKANPLLLASAINEGTAETRAKDTVNGALSILFLIISVVGILFIMYGLARWVMAHSQGDGPAINSAMMFIAAGLGLVLARFVLEKMNLAKWVDVKLIQ